MYEILQETVEKVKKNRKLDVRAPEQFRAVLAQPDTFKMYVDTLSEGIADQKTKNEFKMLAENTRTRLLENSTFQLNPYDTFTLPILRKFYPQLVAKELVNVMPIDKPNVIKYFLKARFKKYTEGNYTDFDYEFPVMNTDISRGPSTGVQVSSRSSDPGAVVNILAVAGLTSVKSHVEKDFEIIAFEDSTATDNPVSITTNVDGTFSQQVESLGGQTDVISGHVDWLKGTFVWSSTTGVVRGVTWKAVCSLEENQINPMVKLDLEPIRLVTVDRRISAEWTINFEQDIKALFDLQAQSELVNMIGDQIALDIDREIVNALIAANSSLNPSSHTEVFDKNPPDTFTWGPKMWYENILPPLSKLSAQIYNSSHMGSANTLACNPLDAAIFESLNTFEYTGTSTTGGDVGYRSATVAGGKWKILVSGVVPQGKILTLYRSNDNARAVFIYAPYVPSLLTPYPLGAIPSLTIMSRYATKVVRNEGIGIMTIVDTSV